MRKGCGVIESYTQTGTHARKLLSDNYDSISTRQSLWMISHDWPKHPRDVATWQTQIGACVPFTDNDDDSKIGCVDLVTKTDRGITGVRPHSVNFTQQCSTVCATGFYAKRYRAIQATVVVFSDRHRMFVRSLRRFVVKILSSGYGYDPRLNGVIPGQLQYGSSFWIKFWRWFANSRSC